MGRRAMRFVTRYNIGDAIWLTGLIREFRRAHPRERIAVEAPGKEELFLNNPYLEGGTEERFPTVLHLSPQDPVGESIGNGVVSYCMQAHVDAYETTPEIWLTPAEIAEGAKIVPRGRRSIAIDTWAMWPSRRWPIENFALLASRLMASGQTVIEIGKDIADDLGNRSVVRIPSHLNLFNRLSLRQAASVLAACDLFIGNDSGMLHLAAAVGTPQVGIFSVKPWYSRAYPSTYPVFRAKRCPPMCGIECCQVEHPCMSSISVERVLAAVEASISLIRKTPPKVRVQG